MNHKNISLSLVLTLVRRSTTLVMKFIQKRNGFTLHKRSQVDDSRTTDILLSSWTCAHKLKVPFNYRRQFLVTRNTRLTKPFTHRQHYTAAQNFEIVLKTCTFLLFANYVLFRNFTHSLRRALMWHTHPSNTEVCQVGRMTDLKRRVASTI